MVEMQNKVYIIIIVILSILVVSLFYMYSSISADYSILAREHETYIELANSRIEELEGNIESLEKFKSSLEIEKGQLEKSYEDLKEEVDEIIEKIETYKNELEKSMEWFKDNSILNEGDSRQKRVINYLDSECLIGKSNTCYIKTGCFWLVNSEKLNYKYKKDIYTSEEEDKLQSLVDFISNKGGDCEDYSLFYKAELNSIIERCEDGGYSNIVIESWIETEKPSGKYWLDKDKDWYLEDVTGIILDEGFIYPNVVCGNIYDLNLDEISPHCIIALTKNKIESIKDMNKLMKAPLFEPQSGMYIGLIDDISSDIGLVTKQNYDYLDSFIDTVITDNDYFLFSESEEEWLSYSIFSEELYDKKMELLKFK